MNIGPLIDDLCLLGGCYRRDLVDQAVLRQEEVVPHLLEILRTVLTDPLVYAGDPGFFGHHYAVTLLGHFREERAHRLIVDIFSLPEDLPYRLFGDIVTEDLPGLLLNTCGGRFATIQNLVNDSAADAFGRAAALRAMTFGVVTGELERAGVVDVMRAILARRPPETTALLLNEAACSLLDLYPIESMDVIRQAFDEDILQADWVSVDAFRQQLQVGLERSLEGLAAEWRRRNPADVHGRMARLACFDLEERCAW